MRRLSTTIALFVALLACGCGSHDDAGVLKPQAFYAPAPTTRPMTSASADSAVTTGSTAAAQPSVLDPAPPTAAPPPAPRRPLPPAQVAGRPTTAPAAALPPNTYMVVGTVIAQANGQPIYADKVLAKIDAELAAKAPQLDPDSFRALARTLITKELETERDNELTYAAAQKNTTDDEKQLATGLTMQWRGREITKAGGSPAVARWMWMHPTDGSAGMDFDEAVTEQYHRILNWIYIERRIEPLVQVSADDMRRYYDQHLDDTFTEKAAVQFRVIRIGVRESGTKERALERMNDVYAKAKSGQPDFAALAGNTNDNTSWRKNDGFMEKVDVKDAVGNPTGAREPVWYEKGSLRDQKLEDAVFALKVGEITDVLDEGEGFYLARLEARKTGSVQAFEDPAVQNLIRLKLESQQRLALRQKEYEKLSRAAVWSADLKSLDLTVEMAMQKYVLWRSVK